MLGTHGPTLLLLHSLPTRVTTTSITHLRETLGQTRLLPLHQSRRHPIGATTLSTAHLPLPV